ncbi:MAG TPA: sialate O-acetylesterase [Pyrinomonadaceae bacterium]|jgi:sialate O-acetylesterase
MIKRIRKHSLKGFGLCLLLLLVLFSAPRARADVKLPNIIGDNMVLQQGRRIRIWGTAQAGEEVSVAVAGRRARAVADAQGRWQTFIGPLKAGGPLQMTITGRNTIVLKNILVGEVWVGSGQSNMEWPLANALNGAEEVAQASYPEIRLFTVKKSTASAPLDDVEGHWTVCAPKTAAQFSAVAYFFGRELHRTLKVPVGLIHSSWGGTPAEAWTSRAALTSNPALKPLMENYQRDLQNRDRLQREYDIAFAEWEKKNVNQDPGNKGLGLGYARPDLDLSDWKRMELPGMLESAGFNFDGAVWFRRDVDIPQSWVGHDLSLELGPIDDFDITYFNGEQVGSTGRETTNAYAVKRRYNVPASLVRPGRNTIAVRVFDRSGDGGFAAGQGEMKLSAAGAEGGGSLPLDGAWSYKVEVEFQPIKPDYSYYPVAPPGPENPNSPSNLYNAMLAPLTGFAIQGVIWYQGETNAGRSYQYRALFPAMIRDWRAAWGEGNFPFYFVQLANYMPVKPEPSESGWAELREAQMMALKEPNTGMAVAIDIGGEDLHPRNKQEVGRRLAQWALAQTYHQKVEPSGPLYDSFVVEGERIRVRFRHVDGGLQTREGSGPLKGFAIAGADRKFVWADARIENDSVIVSHPSITHPLAVRYAWADNPACNLYNRAGLPASPFRTDDWPGVTYGKN